MYASLTFPSNALSNLFSTQMSVNSYRKGCHLLNHDDVIGTRRVSYILYMPIGMDGGRSWNPQWGGALELYPVHSEDGALQPDVKPSLIIPPSWNQVSRLLRMIVCKDSSKTSGILVCILRGPAGLQLPFCGGSSCRHSG